MKIFQSKQPRRAMTLFEVLIVVAVLMLLLALLLPNMARPNYRAQRNNCVNNLKQVGLAFRIWAGDNNEHFPMTVPITNYGTMELVSSGSAFPHFQVMSNEINNPRILFCPEESNRTRTRADTFDLTTTLAGQVPFTGNSNVSYFVGVDAQDSLPQTLLAGDDHFTVNGTAVKPGLLNLFATNSVHWIKPRHQEHGNIAFADGSVQSFDDRQFSQAIALTGLTTNRLAMP
jgi:prepilin-type processing-associated H-X9-DG protein